MLVCIVHTVLTNTMFAICAVRHTSLGEAVIMDIARIICLRQTSFKNRTFVVRQRCGFLLAEREGFEPSVGY